MDEDIDVILDDKELAREKAIKIYFKMRAYLDTRGVPIFNNRDSLSHFLHFLELEI